MARQHRAGEQAAPRAAAKDAVYLYERAPQPMTTSGFHKMLSTVRAACGLSTVHPHQLRHRCGFYLADRKQDVRAMWNWLGHKNTQNTVNTVPTSGFVRRRQRVVNGNRQRRLPPPKGRSPVRNHRFGCTRGAQNHDRGPRSAAVSSSKVKNQNQTSSLNHQSLTAPPVQTPPTGASVRVSDEVHPSVSLVRPDQNEITANRAGQFVPDDRH
jgi:hypothetical protein